jgi:carboxypeptidase C (cathepsin A)
MKFLSILIFLGLLISFSLSENPYPNEIWESDLIDLGNGGDATFYAMIKCKTCENAPLLMWLAGGPGSSSLMFTYLEAGPYLLNDTLKMEYNPYAWTQKMDVMWVDNPVGVPFSKAKNSSTWCRTEKCVCRNLYAFLIKFLEKNPQYRHRPFYMAGESYAGHYIPAFSAYLTKINHPDINFIGGAIGNGMMNHYEQNPFYSDYLYANGNISLPFYAMMKSVELYCEIIYVTHIESQFYFCFYSAFIFASMAGLKSPYDITMTNTTTVAKKLDWIDNYFNSTEVKKAFKVEDQNYEDMAMDIYYAMAGDISLSLSEDIAYSLEHGKKMIFWFGDKDYVCNWMGGYYTVNKIPWNGNAEFKNAELKSWTNKDGKKLGEIKKYKDLTYIRVYDAGHAIFVRQQPSAYQILLEMLA